MEQLLETVGTINGTLNELAWGPAMLLLLAGSGAYLTARTGWLQVTRFRYILRKTVGALFRRGGKQKQGARNLTAFQAVSTALASTVGTGSIAGVTGALFVGGPGAVFWMWVGAFFGMCTKYAEIVLAVKYRQVDARGCYYGGPMYYISRGLGLRWLAAVFAILAGIASFGIGNIAQSVEIASALNSMLGLSPLTSGMLLAGAVGAVILGGVRRIGRIASCLVPFMAGFYLLAGIAMIALHIRDLPAAFSSIFRGAFGLDAIGGGLFGCTAMQAVRNGFARGVFSNEAGLGSAPIAHAAAETKNPVEQGFWGIFEVFVDTMVICTITAMAVLLSGVLDTPGGLDALGGNGAATAAAFNALLPGRWGGIVLQISLLFFAFSSILGWDYYGECCWKYLSGNRPGALLLYRVLFLLVCIVGATGSGELMWSISDTLNGLMALPNLIALLLLSGSVIRMTREYFQGPPHRSI